MGNVQVKIKPKLDENTVYLIDGSGYIFRAFFAIRSLHAKSGVPTNAVFGFTNMLIKLLKEHRPRYLAIAFDRKEPTFRHKIYPEYKANRPMPPADLVPQFELIHRMVEAFNIKLLSEAGFEADDLIATITKRAQKSGHEVVIVTGDKDFMQLVDDHVFLLDELRAARVGSEQFIDRTSVKEELGVFPEQVADLLALAGDSSDNVPGVAGIGKKTAAELLNEFGSLDRILEMIPLIKQKSRQEKLREGRVLAELSKKLVLIDDNVPIKTDIADLRYVGMNQEKLHALFLELDFNRLLGDKTFFKKTENFVDAELEKTKTKKIIDHSLYFSVTNQSALSRLMNNLKTAQKIAIDTETDKIDSNTAKLVGISFAWEENQAAYVPLSHNKNVTREQLDIDVVKTSLGPLLADGNKTIVAQNAKFDHKILVRHGFNDFKIGGDPMLESYLLHQDQERHNLSDMSMKYLDYPAISYEEICGPKKNQIPFADVELSKATAYASEDADLALRLENLLLKKLEASQLAPLYFDVELPLEEVLSRMERVGVKIDTAILSRVGEELKTRLLQLSEKAYELAGVEFNLLSPKQVADILYQKLSLPTIKKTKTGFSTDAFVLEKLAKEHPLANILLEHRMCAKLINTYVETLPTIIDKKTGRIHTNYNQFVAATGRLSSSDPNLQNIPARTGVGRQIRKAFIAEPGSSLISLDYSQVELRILALVSKDEVMLDSFDKDQDVHRRTASEIFDVSPENVTKQQRNAAKTINFGILYGMGAHRLAQTLNIPRKEATTYLEKYFAKYAGIFRWKNEVLTKARKTCEVRTLFGRKRSLPELVSSNAMERARSERIAINTPIQGTAADIIKKAMIDTDKYLRDSYPNAHLIMQVHDELVIEAPSEHAKTIANEVARIMTRGHGLPVLLKVDFGIAENWDDAH